jgi:hypothetical protein
MHPPGTRSVPWRGPPGSHTRRCWPNSRHALPADHAPAPLVRTRPRPRLRRVDDLLRPPAAPRAGAAGGPVRRRAALPHGSLARRRRRSARAHAHRHDPGAGQLRPTGRSRHPRPDAARRGGRRPAVPPLPGVPLRHVARPHAALHRLPRRARRRCSTTASCAWSSTTWATTPRSCRPRGCRTAPAPSSSPTTAADPLPDAAPPHHAVRDVRAQAPRQAADLRRAAVDPAPHGQRQRVQRPLLDPRPRVLPAGARAPRRQSSTTARGRGEVLDQRRGARVLGLLRRDATTAYDTYEPAQRRGDGAPVDPAPPGSPASSPG